MTVTVVGGLIAVVGALIVAIVSGSGGGDPAGPDPPVSADLRVDRWSVEIRGSALLVAARGIARNLDEGDAVYAVLQPAATESSESSGGGQGWFTSPASLPNEDAAWKATIRAPADLDPGFGVFAVQAPYDCPACGEPEEERPQDPGAGGADAGDESFSRRDLKMLGPDAPGIVAVSPVARNPSGG